MIKNTSKYVSRKNCYYSCAFKNDNDFPYMAELKVKFETQITGTSELSVYRNSYPTHTEKAFDKIKYY